MIMAKKDKDKRNPEPPIVLRDVLAGKPELIVHTADLTVTARALAKLLAQQCNNLFLHADRPVLVIPADDGIPTIRPLSCNEIIIAAHKVCQPVKPNPRREVTLPDKVAELYLAMPDEWRLRELAGVTTGPILHADGSIRTAPGYDDETRCLCCCNLTLTMPDKPSIDDAKRALATLRHSFRTHAFADRVTVPEEFSIDSRSVKNDVVNLEQAPGKDESAYLVALSTAVTRASLPLAPGFAWRAPDTSGSGAGKDFLVKAIAIVAFGNNEPRPVPPRASREELDKTITAELLRGEPFVYLQNFNDLTLQSPVLCVALTDRHTQLRIMGKSEMGENAKAFIAITGNALIIGQDLVRRVITIGIDARCENPELREFAGDFLADIRRQRGELLTAVLTIWRWGRQAKLTRKGAKPLGGFEQWTAWVRDPLLALGCHDPVARVAELKTSDPYRQATVDIFETWWEHHEDKSVKASELADEVQALLIPDPKRTRQSVAARVAKLAGTRIAGFHLTSNKDDKGRWTPLSYQLLQVETDKTVSGEEDLFAATSADENASSDSEAQCVVEQAAAEGAAAGRDRNDDEPPPLMPCAHCGRADGAVYQMKNIHLFDPLNPPPGEEPMVYLHEACTEQFFARADGQPAEGATASVPFMMTRELKSQLQACGYSAAEIANRTPQKAHDILREVAPPAAATAQGGLAEEKPVGVHAEEKPAPSHPLARLQASAARLEPSREPCAGYRPGEWPRVYRVIAAFLAGPFAKLAVDAGWTELELVGVHP